MLNWFKDRHRRATIARSLYGSSVAQARAVTFYRDWHVADAIEGRFELVTLHVALLLRRLTAEGAAGKRLGQALLEAMVSALDDDMRAIGVGDYTVPKRVQGAASAFYGRLRAYDEALTAGDMGKLRAAFLRNVPPAPGGTLQADKLADYAVRLASDLARQPFDALNQGHVSFARLEGLQA